jgi:hypothetical protein
MLYLVYSNLNTYYEYSREIGISETNLLIVRPVGNTCTNNNGSRLGRLKNLEIRNTALKGAQA